MVFVLREVDEEHGPVAEVIDHGFEAAVVEEICDSEAALERGSASPRPDWFADIAELPVAKMLYRKRGSR